MICATVDQWPTAARAPGRQLRSTGPTSRPQRGHERLRSRPGSVARGGFSQANTLVDYRGGSAPDERRRRPRRDADHPRAAFGSRTGVRRLRWSAARSFACRAGVAHAVTSNVGARHAVIVQADEFLALSTVLVSPTSTRASAASFRPEITIDGTVTRVVVEQTTVVDPERLVLLKPLRQRRRASGGRRSPRVDAQHLARRKQATSRAGLDPLPALDPAHPRRRRTVSVLSS